MLRYVFLSATDKLSKMGKNVSIRNCKLPSSIISTELPSPNCLFFLRDHEKYLPHSKDPSQ